MTTEKHNPRSGTNESRLYHIHTLGTPHDALWTPDSAFIVKQGERNHFLQYYDTATIGIHLPDSPTMPISRAIRMFEAMPEEDWHRNCRILLQQAGKAVKEMGTYIREIIFEEIRRNEFPDLPSRVNCVWLCDASGISYWWPRMHSGKKVILEAHVVGTLHRANPDFLVSDSISHDELRALARKYWGGENVRNQSNEELLFYGEVRVLHQYDDLATFTERHPSQ